VSCEQLLAVKTYHVIKYKLVRQTWTDPLVWAEYRDKWQSLVNAVLESGFHKMGEFLDQLRTSYFLMKVSAPWSQYVSMQYSIKYKAK